MFIQQQNSAVLTVIEFYPSARRSISVAAGLKLLRLTIHGHPAASFRAIHKSFDARLLGPSAGGFAP
ncbi:hypothetical protein D3C73_1359220 [compost metagenome]